MSYIVKKSSRALRISLVLAVLAAGLATHAFAAGSDTPQSVGQPKITLYDAVSTYKYVPIGTSYGPKLVKTDVTSANGDILEHEAYGKNYGRKFVNYTGTANAPTITKTTSDHDFKISFKSTIKNAGTFDLNGYMFFESFAPAGVTISNVTITPLNDLSGQHFVKVFKPGEYSTVSANQKSDWIAHVTNTSNGSVTMSRTIAPHFVPGSELDFRFDINLTIASNALAADLSCEGSQVQGEDYFYDNLPGRKGIVLRTSLNQSATSEFGKIDMSGIPTSGNGYEMSRRDARYCADFSSVVAPVVTTAPSTAAPTTGGAATTAPATNATTPATNATTPATNATTPATNATVPQATNVTVPQYNGNDAAGNAGNGSNNGALNDASNHSTAGAEGTNDASSHTHGASTVNETPSLNAGGVPRAQSGVSPDFVSELTGNSPDNLGPVSEYKSLAPAKDSDFIAKNVDADVVDGVLAQGNTPSGSSSQNVEYAIAGLLVLCALTALAAHKKFGGASMEVASSPRVRLSPSEALEMPRSLNNDPRLYNSELHMIDLAGELEIERERELVGVSAASISSGASKARPRAFDPTQHDRQALPSRIWNELVSRLTREHHTVK